MKPLHTFKIGSSIFFQKYPDYNVKDVDYIAIMNTFPFNAKLMLKVHIEQDDIFMYKPSVTKQDFIDEVYNTKVFMKAGKFLSPDFCKFINFSIEDLKQFEQIFASLDDKHKYEKIIYDSYIENNDFTLTEEQRDKAYQIYKSSRMN